MVILSFGSGFNLESTDPNYRALYKKLADEARAKGIALGGYSLLASRGSPVPADNATGPCPFGVIPCLGSNDGRRYLRDILSFMKEAGLTVFENDGSYPGDMCSATNHPGHHGLEDSTWAMWRAITDFYKECRAEQEIIERQNIFDGTWTKTQSMGWMFVPLSQYHGGGAAATIEPLCEHLPHYEARFANLLGAGVQACYRGPRLFDAEETKALVKKWVGFYKTHREVLQADIIHLRRANGLDWDGIVHVNPQGTEKAMAFFYNPLPETIARDIRVPLYYAGLTGKTTVSIDGGEPFVATLDRNETATLHVTIPAGKHTWALFTEAKD